MSNLEKINSLIQWIEDFKAHTFHTLHSEEDVNTKFVLPLLQHLGYLDPYLRNAYPVSEYRQGKRGRNSESDKVYFAFSEDEKQNPDTCLIVVESKKPQMNLDKAVIQAKFYGAYLEPVFYVMTNGKQLRVIKRHRYRGGEELFDIDINELRDQALAKKIYESLNFSTAISINETHADPLIHEQYVLLHKSLETYPDIKRILDKGDFTESTRKNGNELTAVKPKVSITCTLPVAFNEGNCEIKFSSITLRGLTIYLNHNDILKELMIGLNTTPDQENRTFIKKLNDRTFSVSLFDKASLIISDVEAKDLCSCVDEVCTEYKGRMIEAENTFKSWNFKHVQSRYWDSSCGFHLLSIRREFWKLMLRFSHEFDWYEGNSGWHIFHPTWETISIQKQRCHFPAELIPENRNPLSEFVDILYKIPNRLDTEKDDQWKYEIGSKGIWTVSHTKDWLKNDFIPKVEEYYAEEYEEMMLKILNCKTGESYQLMDDDYNMEDLIQIQEVDEIRDLVPYLKAVQEWLRRSKARNIASSDLRALYKSFADIICNSHPSAEIREKLLYPSYFLSEWMDIPVVESPLDKQTSEEYEECIDTAYIREKLSIAEDILNGKATAGYPNWSPLEIKDILRWHVERINHSEIESTDCADMLTRVFSSAIGTWDICCSQVQLNIAKEALIPLREQSSFEQRYVRSTFE